MSRCLTVLSGAVASIAALSCGGDNLVLPSEGTAARITIVSGNPQNGTVGAALADSLVVRVLDQAGRPVPSQTVSWSVVAGGGSVAPVSATTDQDGRTAASWTLGSGAGTQQVRAKPTGNGAPDTLQALFAATAGASSAADLAKLAGDNQTAVAGSVLPDSLVVRVTDASSNPVAGVQVAWTLSGGGAVSSAATPTGADGRAAVQRTLGATAGSQTTTAGAGGLQGSPVVFTSTATVGLAGSLVITQQPSSSASSGAAFPRQPKVQIQDANGNPVSLAGIAVQAAFASNPGAGNLLGNSTATTDATGLATFQNLGISGPAGSYTLNFSVPNRTDISGTPPSSTITISAGSAARLRFAVQPTSIATGGTIAPPVTVQVQDALGNLVSSATTAVTVGLGVNPSGATLSGTKTANAIGGIATFAGLSLNRPGTGYTLSALASGLSGDASSPFNVTTGAASQIAANSATALSGTAGGAVTPKPSVLVSDGAGNPVGGVNVTFAVTAGGGSESGATQTTDASGIATIGGWTLGSTAGANTLTASASGLTGSPVTFTATASAGAAGKLVIITQPGGTATSGSSLSPQPVLQLVDANNNPVSTGGITVTATIASGPGGSLSSATTNTASNGRATFAGLRISGPSGTYTLGFAAPSITGVTSSNIVLGAGSATKLGITTQPSGAAANGAPFAVQPVIQVQDGDGNPVGTAGVNVVVSIQTGGGSLGGDLTVQSNSSGQATFTDLKITGTVGNRILLFAAPSLTTTTSTAINVTPGPVDAATSTVSAAPLSFVAGNAGGATITVTARDQSSNVISGATVAPSATNGGTLDPTSSTTSATGQVTFTFNSTSANTHQISAVVDGVTITQKPTVTVTAAPPDAASSSVAVSPATVALGSATVVSMTFKDQFGNPVAGNVSLASDGSGDFADNPVALNASGQGSTSFTPSSAGSQTITAQIGSASVQATLQVDPAPVSPGNSTLTVGPPTTVTASATTGRNVVVNARNSLNQVMANATVALSVTGSSNTVATSPAPTDASGNATFVVSSTRAELKTISATINSVSVTQTGTLTVTPDVPDAGFSAVTPESPVALDIPSTVTVTVMDQFGNPVPAATVTLAETGGGGIVTQPAATTDAGGQATGSFSSSAAGSFTVQATADGVVINQTASIIVQ